MKILFVYPNFTRQTTPQVGIASLLSVISQKHQTAFFDFTVIPQGEEYGAYMEMFRNFKPDYVLISCRSNEWGVVKWIIENSYPVPSIVGGIHPTVAPEEVLERAKFAIRGEGEGAIEELLDKLEKGEDTTNIPNVWTRQKGKVYQNDVRDLIQDLDTLPLPLWRAFDGVHYFKSYIKNLFPDIECVGTFETSRGCPYSCTYCCNYFLHDLYKGKGKYHRRKSPERVLKEIEEFKKIYPKCNFLYFVDDTFMVDREWLEEFSEGYDKTPFVFMTRAEMATPDKMKLAADMGARAVSIGIESGNEKFRKEVLGRTMSNDQIIQAFKTAKDYGLKVYSFNMVGLPDETPDDILATIELNKKVKPDIAQFTIFFPFKGTRLFDICKEKGYINGNYPETFSNYYNQSFLKLPNFKKGEIEKWAKRAERELKSN